MPQTVRDVLIRFRVEGPRAGSIPSPAAGSIGVPGGGGGAAAAGMSPGEAGAGASAPGMLKALAELTTAIIQLTIIARLSAIGGGLFKGFSLARRAGLGVAGSSLMGTGAAVMARIAPIAAVAAPASISLLALSARSAINNQLDEALGVNELEPEIGQRPLFRGISALGIAREVGIFLSDPTAGVQETFRRGGVRGARAYLKATGQRIPRHLSGPEIEAGIGRMRAGEIGQFQRGQQQGSFLVSQGLLGQVGRQREFFGGGSAEGNIAAAEQTLQQSMTELRRREGLVPNVPTTGEGLVPGELRRTRGIALETERSAQDQRLQIARQIRDLDLQRLQYAREQLSLAGGMALNALAAGPVDRRMATDLGKIIQSGRPLNATEAALIQVSSPLLNPDLIRAAQSQAHRQLGGTLYGQMNLPQLAPEMLPPGVEATATALDNYLKSPAFQAAMEKAGQAMAKELQAGGQRIVELGEEGAVAVKLKDARGDNGESQRRAAGR